MRAWRCRRTYSERAALTAWRFVLCRPSFTASATILSSNFRFVGMNSLSPTHPRVSSRLLGHIGSVAQHLRSPARRRSLLARDRSVTVRFNATFQQTPQRASSGVRTGLDLLKARFLFLRRDAGP